jgi:hypothetical protein
MGVAFTVDSKHVYRQGEQLLLAPLSYKVRHKSQLKGKREVAAFWKYEIELTYLKMTLSHILSSGSANSVISPAKPTTSK